MAEIINKQTMQTLALEVTDVQQAEGFGLHLAASPDARGRGSYPELYLHAAEDGEVVFVYHDGGRAPRPFVGEGPGEVPLFISNLAVVSDTTALPVEHPATALDPSEQPVDTPDDTIDSDSFPSELAGLHRFIVPLGHRRSLLSITIALQAHCLRVYAERRSSHTGGGPRMFHMDADIYLGEGDLGARTELFYSAVGLLSGAAGSGWQSKEPKLVFEGGGGDDSTLAAGTHHDTDPNVNPTGG